MLFSASIKRNGTGEVVGIAVTCSDSQENGSDSLLAGIVRGARHGIFSIDLSGIVRSWNSSATQMFGFNEIETVGNHLTKLFACEREVIDSIIRDVMNGQSINEIELPLSRTGHQKKVSVQFSKHLAADNSVQGYAAICRDVTEERTQFDHIASEYKTMAQTNRLLADHAAGLSRQSAQMELFAEMSGSLQMCGSEPELYELISRTGAKLFPQTCGAFFIASGPDNELKHAAAWGYASTEHRDMPTHGCFALKSSRTHFFLRAVADSELCPHVSAEMNSSMCVPMMLKGELVGLLTVGWTGSQAFSETAAIAARLLSDASLTLANLRLKQELKELSIRDSLTGLYNRRYMQEFLTQELIRSKRKRSELSVIIFDIDHFKMFNDKHGHHAGDAVLKDVGKLTSQMARASDAACRYGGEEFIIVFPEFRISAVAQRAEQIRQAAEAMQVTYNGRALPQVTFSLGVAGFPVHGDTPEVIIRQADAALYSAKHLGRNRVVVASRSPSSRKC